MLAPTAPAWDFADVTRRAGLDYEHGWNEEPEFTEEQWLAAGVAAGDYDGDGQVDLYVARGTIGPNLLFRNRGGTFEEVGAAAGVALNGVSSCGPAFADLDGDGWLDLFVGGVDGTPPSIFRNRGDGTFEDVTTRTGVNMPRNSVSVAFGDYDRDGDLDFYVTHWGTPKTITGHLWRNNGDFTFTDMDKLINLPPVPLRTDYTFTPCFADIDSDGWPDLLIASDFLTSQVLRNRGDGTFEDITDRDVITDDNGMGSAVGDYDNDGDLDWFVTSIVDVLRTGNRLYRNRGDGTFEDVTEATGVRDGWWGWGASFADFNNDGHLDLFHVNGWWFVEDDPSVLFVADGHGSFTEQAHRRHIADTGQGRGVVCFDYDRDGDLDVFIANNQGRQILYRNDGGNHNNSLGVKLVGNAPNTEAVGARIYATAMGITQMRELNLGSNFVSHNPTEAHFGLGTAESVDELRIEWPSGAVQVLRGVAANQQLVITETTVAVELTGFAASSVGEDIKLEWQLSADATRRLSGVIVQRAPQASGPYASLTRAPLPPGREMSYVDQMGIHPVAWYRLLLAEPSGEHAAMGPFRVHIEGDGARDEILVTKNLPSGSIQIDYTIAERAYTVLMLFDAKGRIVRELHRDWLDPGTYSRTWDGSDPSGRRVARGVYFVRLNAAGSGNTKKVLVLQR